MRPRLTLRRAVLLLPLVALAVAAGPANAAAAEKRCGSLGSLAPDYRDVRALETSCKSARSLVRSYVGAACGNVLNRCRVRGYTCKGLRSERVIDGRTTFRINCRHAPAKVRWWITVFH